MTDFWIKRGDRKDSVEATLKDATGATVDLTGATVTFNMRAPGAASPKVSASAVNLDTGTATRGKVRYDWAAADTDTAGLYYAEFEVTFADGKRASFPSHTHLVVEVVEDLG